MKELVILRGLPGSGKSTFAHLLTTGRNSVIIENDQHMYEDGVYIWKPSKMKGAIKETNEKLYRALKEGVELIVIANVNVRLADFNRYMEMGKEHGYKITSLVCENRANTKSKHGVDEETLCSMEENFQLKLR